MTEIISDDIKRIEDGLRNGHYQTNPFQSANDLGMLAGEYSFTCGILEDIWQRKPAVWNELRKSVKSDTACERVWEQTVDGINEMGMKLRLKRISFMMSALKSIIRLAETEIKNL